MTEHGLERGQRGERIGRSRKDRGEPQRIDAEQGRLDILVNDIWGGELLAQARVLAALFGEQSMVTAFGRFQVLKRLGAGGMGVVYEGKDPTQVDSLELRG